MTCSVRNPALVETAVETPKCSRRALLLGWDPVLGVVGVGQKGELILEGVGRLERIPAEFLER